MLHWLRILSVNVHESLFHKGSWVHSITNWFLLICSPAMAEVIKNLLISERVSSRKYIAFEIVYIIQVWSIWLWQLMVQLCRVCLQIFDPSVWTFKWTHCMQNSEILSMMSYDCDVPVVKVEAKRMAFRLLFWFLAMEWVLQIIIFRNKRTCTLIVKDFRMLHLTTCAYSGMETSMEVINIHILIPV